MRIAWLVHQYVPDEIGGTELYTHGLARRAQDAGHEVIVISYAEHPGGDAAQWDVRACEHEGIPVRRIEHNVSLAPVIARWEYRNPVVGARVRDLLASFRPDVVHCTHAMKLSASALDACADLGIPFVVTLCDFWFVCPRHTLLRADGRVCDGPFDSRACLACTADLHAIDAADEAEVAAVRERPAALREALGRAERVVALSQFQRRTFERCGVDPARMVVVPHGLEPDGLDAPAARNGNGRGRFVFAGSLVEHKGAHVAVAALAQRPGLDATFDLHGAGRDDRYVRELIAAADRDSRVRVTGRFAPYELGAIVAGADAVVVPALWYENDPLVVKAALHRGVPVVASRIGSLAEQIRDGVDGWTLPPGDVDAWAAGLERALTWRDRPRCPRPQPTMDDHYGVIESILAEAAA